MKLYHSPFNLLMVLFGTLYLISCSTTPEPAEPETIPVPLSILASKNINPDFKKRASPIVIRIYQLTHIDTFDNNDFFTLYENDQTVLAKDLLYREEIEITPGQEITRKAFEVHRKSKYIAVLAAYRDLDKSQWKSIFKFNPAIEQEPLQIDVNEFEVLIKKASKPDAENDAGFFEFLFFW